MSNGLVEHEDGASQVEAPARIGVHPLALDGQRLRVVVRSCPRCAEPLRIEDDVVAVPRAELITLLGRTYVMAHSADCRLGLSA